MIMDFKLILESDGKKGIIHTTSLKVLMDCLTEKGLNYLQIAGMNGEILELKELEKESLK